MAPKSGSAPSKTSAQFGNFLTTGNFEEEYWSLLVWTTTVANRYVELARSLSEEFPEFSQVLRVERVYPGHTGLSKIPIIRVLGAYHYFRCIE
jgi:hypothetical protein